MSASSPVVSNLLEHNITRKKPRTIASPISLHKMVHGLTNGTQTLDVAKASRPWVVHRGDVEGTYSNYGHYPRWLRKMRLNYTGNTRKTKNLDWREVCEKPEK